MKKTISEYAQEVERLADSPDGLVRLKIVLATNLASLYEVEYKPVKLAKDRFWNMKFVDEKGFERAKPLSDTTIEHRWGLTEDGEKETRLDITIKSYKLLIDAITTSVTWAQSSAKMER